MRDAPADTRSPRTLAPKVHFSQDPTTPVIWENVQFRSLGYDESVRCELHKLAGKERWY